MTRSWARAGRTGQHRSGRPRYPPGITVVGVETRELRYFVAVAEELHFGRAAERLGMAQPPLSRAIREMERQLGVTLMERTTRRAALTPAGEILLRDARTALDAITAAARRARHAGQPDPGLRLALKADF